MNDQEVEAVSGCQTSAEIWSKLSAMYLSVSGASKQVLWQKYYGVMAGSDKTPVKAMLEIQNLASQLRSMGVTIDEDMEVARIVSSLMYDKYRQFREAWRSVEPAKQTTGLLLTRLKTWEMKECPPNPTAQLELLEKHRAYAVRKVRKKSKEEFAELKQKTNCHICRKQGHWKSECPQKDKKKQMPGDQNRRAYMPGDHTRKAYMANGNSSQVESDIWINDSGATGHYCGRLDWFANYRKYPEPIPIELADNSVVNAEGIGRVNVLALIRGEWQRIEIHDVEYIRGAVSLISENLMLTRGYEIRKNRRGSRIKYYLNGVPDIQAEIRDGIQVMLFKPIVNKAFYIKKKPNQEEPGSQEALWHQRLGHINVKFLKLTSESGAVYGLEDVKFGNSKNCDICIQTKTKRESYKSVKLACQYNVGECLHADLGHANVDSYRGNKYFLLVKDEASNFRQIYARKSKTETVANMQAAVNLIANQTGNSVKMFRSDNGTEFKKKSFCHSSRRKESKYDLTHLTVAKVMGLWRGTYKQYRKRGEQCCAKAKSARNIGTML
jgi:hypothetical protein